MILSHLRKIRYLRHPYPYHKGYLKAYKRLKILVSRLVKMAKWEQKARMYEERLSEFEKTNFKTLLALIQTSRITKGKSSLGEGGSQSWLGPAGMMNTCLGRGYTSSTAL